MTQVHLFSTKPTEHYSKNYKYCNFYDPFYFFYLFFLWQIQRRIAVGPGYEPSSAATATISTTTTYVLLYSSSITDTVTTATPTNPTGYCSLLAKQFWFF